MLIVIYLYYQSHYLKLYLLLSEVATKQQVDNIAYKLKPRLFWNFIILYS